MKITINNKEYAVKFGYRATKILADIWGLTKPLEVDAKIKALMKKGNNLEFEEMDEMGDFYYSAVLAANSDFTLSRDDFMECLFDNPQSIKTLMDAYIKASPVQGNEVAPQKRGKN